MAGRGSRKNIIDKFKLNKEAKILKSKIGEMQGVVLLIASEIEEDVIKLVETTMLITEMKVTRCKKMERISNSIKTCQGRKW